MSEYMSKQDLLKYVEQLPEDAGIVIYSVNADEYYEPEDHGDLFRVIDTEEREQCDIPEGATHVIDMI